MNTSRKAAPGEITSLHVRRAVAGDRGSVSWLVERLNPLLLAQTRWRLGGQLATVCDPADLVQEAWIVLLPRLPELQQREGRLTPVLLSFLTSSIVRKLHNLLRREARRRVHVEPVVPDAPEFTPDLTHPATGVVSGIVRGERQCQVRDALDRLTTDDRAAIVMRGIEQQPLAEVADHFGVTLKAMSKRYSRALERLRERLPDSVFAELADE
ncbi:MAG: sigma-70 family RNA polymerase sigma factor [bacterium]|nr:sigma-70 family RNA polymerase sigma factor [bacterium]